MGLTAGATAGVLRGMGPCHVPGIREGTWTRCLVGTTMSPSKVEAGLARSAWGVVHGVWVEESSWRGA